MTKKTYLTLLAAVATTVQANAYDVLVTGPDGQTFRAQADAVQSITFDQDAPVLDFTGDLSSQIKAGMQAASLSVDFTAPFYWVLAQDADADWLTVGKQWGLAGDNSLHLQLTANETGVPRTATFALLVGFTRVEFEVIQSATPGDSDIYIPDANFLAKLLKDFDKNSDGQITLDEALEIRTLDVASCGIKSLEGIRAMANLEVLKCGSNSIDGTLDLSGLTNLRELNCGYNQYTKLNLSGCSSLESVTAYDNWVYDANRNPVFLMKEIDLTGCAKLSYLNLQDNGLEAIDLSDCVALEDLHLEINQLPAVDLTHCPKLRWAHIRNNQFDGAAVDLSKCPVIEGVFASDMGLGGINVAGCNKLRQLSIQNNRVTELNIEGCTALQELTAFNNQLSELDVTGCPKLTTLWASFNNISSINVANCPELKIFSMGWNSLSGAVDLTANPKLREISIQSNPMTELLTDDLGNLDLIDVTESHLSELDLSRAPYVTTIKANQNQLVSLNIKGCRDIYMISVNENKLTSLDLSGTPWLSILEVENNLLTELDLSGCEYLSELLAKSNRISNINLRNCSLMTTAEIYDNQITELDLTDCVSLSELHFQNNQVNVFDPSPCQSLYYVDCRNNDLGPVIDFSLNTALSYVFGTDNPKMVQVWLSDLAPNEHIEFDPDVKINLKRVD